MRKASDSTQLITLRREMKQVVQERQVWASRAGMAERELVKAERELAKSQADIAQLKVWLETLLGAVSRGTEGKP